MNLDERDSVARHFAVTPEQVERDHLISHLLAVLSDRFSDRLHFIGGTALARTHLPDGRLSEDVDLIALGNRSALADDLENALPRSVQRTHGRLIWANSFSSASDTIAAGLRASDGLSVKIHLLSSHGRILWPTERRALIQRYRDAPSAELIVPTRSAFAASKTATWYDRRASRDLWDLWALSKLGAIDDAAADLYRRYGPTNRPPGADLFKNPPADRDWQSQLAAQTRLKVTAATALAEVRDAWGQMADTP